MSTQNDPASKYIEKGIYRHYKTGKAYEVIGVALQTETNEQLVIYRPLYDDCQYELFARPFDMFTESATSDGVKVPRFERAG